MKKSIVAAVILAACLLLAPFGFGKLAEKRVNAALDKIVEQAPYLVIDSRSWEGGWFRSRQVVTFGLAPALRGMVSQAVEQAAASEGAEAVPDLPTAFTVHNAVLHGPVLGKGGLGLARVDTTFDLPAEFVAEVRKLFGPEPALEIYSTLGFTGGGKMVFTSQGRVIKPAGQDVEISYDTFRLVTAYGRNADSYDIEGGLPRFAVKGERGESLLLTGLTIEGEGERVKGDLYDGDMALRVRQVATTSATGGDFSVADIHYLVDSGTDDGFMGIAARLGSGAVKNDGISAIGLDISEIHYDFALRRLHADTVEKIISGMRDAYADLPQQEDAAATAHELQARIIQPLREHGAELLKHNPEFALDRVGLVTPQGEAVLRGVIRLVGVTPDDLTAAGLAGLARKIEVELDCELAQALVEKVPNGALFSGMGIEGGYLVREGGKLVSRIEYKDGQLTINGKVQALPPIPGLGGPAPGALPAPAADPAPPAPGA